MTLPQMKQLTAQMIMGLIAGLSGGVAVLIYFASTGEVWAIIILFTVWSVGCIFIGWAMATVSATTAIKVNAVENQMAAGSDLAMMKQMAQVGTAQARQIKANQQILQGRPQAAAPEIIDMPVMQWENGNGVEIITINP